MKKSQEAYGKALKQLDAAVKSARNAHQAEIDRLRKAEAALDVLPRGLDAVAQAKRVVARNMLDEVKAGFSNAVNRVFDKFDSTVAQVRQELADALQEAAVLKAGDMDPAAVALLNSGTMRPLDMAQMIQDFSENATILTLLRREAQRQLDALNVDGVGAAEARKELLEVIEAARTDGGEFLEDFDNLVKGARILAGRTADGTFSSTDRIFSAASLSSWEALTSNFIPEDAEK